MQKFIIKTFQWQSLKLCIIETISRLLMHFHIFDLSPKINLFFIYYTNFKIVRKHFCLVDSNDNFKTLLIIPIKFVQFSDSIISKDQQKFSLSRLKNREIQNRLFTTSIISARSLCILHSYDKLHTFRFPIIFQAKRVTQRGSDPRSIRC